MIYYNNKPREKYHRAKEKANDKNLLKYVEQMVEMEKIA
jgi:hypothetical protein